jgi:hypothetical protein
VGVFSVVELKGAADAVQDGFRDAGGIAAFQPGVVLDTDACDKRDFLAAEPVDAATTTEVG